MHTVKVNLKKKADRSYDLLIENGLFRQIPSDLAKRKYGNKYAIIADTRVANLYGKKLFRIMKKHGFKVNLITFPPGEGSKSMLKYSLLMEQVFTKKLDRGSCIIALGGGVTGDLAGFIAATYMRGINYVQIPTSVIAMCDSSIGGKTAVNLSSAKNITGVFHQPKRVYIDPLLLKTLPDRLFREGIAEVIKHAIIKDRKLFKLLETNKERILKKNPKLMEKVVLRNCEIKAKIVEADEHESSKKGTRKLLNFGHTIGHAVEEEMSFTLTHGEAVAIGLCAEAKLANQKKLLSKPAFERICKLVSLYKLPSKIPTANPKKLVKNMFHDKKTKDRKIEFILPSAIGKIALSKKSYSRAVPEKQILKALKEMKK